MLTRRSHSELKPRIEERKQAGRVIDTWPLCGRSLAAVCPPRQQVEGECSRLSKLVAVYQKKVAKAEAGKKGDEDERERLQTSASDMDREVRAAGHRGSRVAG